MRRKKISVIGALVLGLVMSGCGSVATRLEPNRLNANYTDALIKFGSASGSTPVNDFEITGNDSEGNEWTITTVATQKSFTQSTNYSQIGASSKPATSITFTTTLPAGDYTVTKFQAKFGGFSNTAGDVTLKVGDTTVGSGSLNASSDVTVSNDVDDATGNVLTVSVENIAKGVKAYQIVYSCTDNNAQQAVNLTNPNPQFDSNNKRITWTLDENASGYQVKIDNGNWVDVEQDIDYYDVSSEIGTHTCTVKAVGDGVSYNTVQASINFTIQPVFTAKIYALCTKASDLEVGAKYIVTNDMVGDIKAMSTEVNSNNVRQTAVGLKSGTNNIESTYETLVLELGGANNAWTFKTTNYAGTNGYFESAASGNSNYLLVKAHDSVNDIPDNGKFTVSFVGNTASIVANAGNKTIMRYNTSGMFSLYGSGQNEIYLWKEVTKTVESLTVTGTPSKTTYFVEEQFDPTGITSIVANYSDNSTKDLALTDLSWPVLYLSDHTARGSYTELGTTVYTPNYDVTVQNDSIETLTISGNMTKTAYFTSEQWDKTGLVVTAHYLSGRNLTVVANLYIYSDYEMTNLVERPEDLNQTGSNLKIYIKAEYDQVVSTTPYEQTVSVTVEHGTTASDPLTATEAFNMGNALADGAYTEKYYYIEGVVSEIVGDPAADMESYGNVTFWIENENDHTARYFEAFRVVPAVAGDVAKLRVGAEVSFCGSIQKYVKDNVTTIETKAGATLLTVTYDQVELTGIALNKTNVCLAIGGEDKLTVTAIPTGAEIGTVTWSSTDDNVVMVDNEGNLLAIEEGTSTVRARVSDTIYADCSVVVNKPSHKLSSSLFSLDFASSFKAPDGFTGTYGCVTHNNNGYFIENGTNNEDTAFFYIAGGEPLFGLGSGEVEFKAKISSGNNRPELVHKVEVSLIDMGGNVIDGTTKVLTDTLSTDATVYSVKLPYSEDAYGVKMTHLKESGYTARYYGMELNYKVIETYATLLADEKNNGVENVKIKFGAKVSTAAWDEIILTHGEITDYGVMMFKQTRSPDNYSKTPVQDIYKQGLVLNNIHKGDGYPVSTSGGYYTFSAKVNITNTANYGVVFCAAPYVIAGGEVYFLGEMQFSVNTLAQYHQANGGSNLSDTALDLLAGTNN